MALLFFYISSLFFVILIGLKQLLLEKKCFFEIKLGTVTDEYYSSGF